MDPIEYVRTLSAEQAVAAKNTDNPVMIVACAGSGKTRTLVGRILHLVMPKSMGGLGADPSSIMMVTFTNKAAKEMRERVKPAIDGLRAIDPSINGEPWIGTFHGLSLRILRIEAKRAGLGPNFSIFDESDAQGLAKEVAEQLEIEAFDVDDFFRDLEKAKSRMLSSELISQKAFDIHMAEMTGQTLSKDLTTWKRILDTFETDGFPRLYSGYQASLNEQNAVDFSDLMNRTTQLFQDNKEVRDSWRSSIRHFMVDEVQDTNRAQMAWLDALTDGGREMQVPEGSYDNRMADASSGLHEINTYRLRQFPRPTIALVGDDDQSIYAFRGSDPRIMRMFQNRYPGLEINMLRQSYRCQPSILDAANTLVSGNTNRFDKVIEPAFPDRARATVTVEEHFSPDQEIRRLAAEAVSHIASGGNPADYAILTRTRDHAKAVARQLREHGLPVTEGKASDIRKTAEVRDAMAFAGFVTNPDAEVYLRRIINKPTRGLGPTSMARVNANARKKVNTSFMDELRSIIENRIEIPEDGEAYKPAFVRKLKEFEFLMDQMRADARHAPNAGRAIEAVLERAGYMQDKKRDALSAAGVRPEDPVTAELMALSPRPFLTKLIGIAAEGKNKQVEDDITSEDLADRAGQMSDASRRLGNLALLLEQAEPHESLDAFMQEATLEMDQSAQAPGVQVMTVHASKGLEFEKVRLPFWMEGIFPHSRALEEGEDAIEEERRLAYVALTRAIEDVRISRSWNIRGCKFIRGRTDRPSRFIGEIRHSPNKSVKLTSVEGKNNPLYKIGKLPEPKPAPVEQAQPQEDPFDQPFAPISEEEFEQMQGAPMSEEDFAQMQGAPEPEDDPMFSF